MSAELIAIIAVGCTVVGLLLANRRHADARMDGMQARMDGMQARMDDRMDAMQTALAALGERVARIEGMFAVFGHSGELPPET